MEHRELWQLAAMDSLTGVSSRREGKDRLELIVKRAKKEKKMLTVAMFDIDSLNWINNRYGDGEGDRVLQFVTSASRRCLCPEDVIFRLSSDEFIVAFYGEELISAYRRFWKYWRESGKITDWSASRLFLMEQWKSILRTALQFPIS